MCEKSKVRCLLQQTPHLSKQLKLKLTNFILKLFLDKINEVGNFTRKIVPGKYSQIQTRLNMYPHPIKIIGRWHFCVQKNNWTLYFCVQKNNWTPAFLRPKNNWTHASNSELDAGTCLDGLVRL